MNIRAETGYGRRSKRALWAALCLTLIAGVVPVVDAGLAGAQSATDSDSVRAGATDLGDVTTWSGTSSSVGVTEDAVNGKDDAVDYFELSLSETKLLGVGLSGMEFNADVYVEDGNGVVLASSTKFANQKEQLTVGLESGTYFVRVEAQQRGSNTYLLKINTAKPDSVTSSFDTSKLLSMTEEVAARSLPEPTCLSKEKISPHWDIDWVRVELDEDTDYVIEVRGRGSGEGSLIDPELKGIFVDPSDHDMFKTYLGLDLVSLKPVGPGRLRRGLREQIIEQTSKGELSLDELLDELLPEDGRIRTNGLSIYDPEDPPEHYPSPPDAWSSAGFTDAHDFDDGWGQDAWLLFRPASTGSHWIEVDSQGGFAGSYVIAITDAAQYNEREYENGSSAACLTSRVVEPEHDPRLVFSTNVLSVAEGDTARYTLRLATEPTAPVSVTVSSGDTGALAVPSMSLAFTTSNWHEEQSVTVRGVHDNDTSAESVTVSHTASGGDYKSITGSVTVRVIDDDAPALVLSADELRVDEGDTETYSLRLATKPVGAGDGGGPVGRLGRGGSAGELRVHDRELEPAAPGDRARHRGRRHLRRDGDGVARGVRGRLRRNSRVVGPCTSSMTTRRCPGVLAFVRWTWARATPRRTRCVSRRARRGR